MSDLLSFHVRNLGPIVEGTVELHPLTILIGKNNTGKTYMAQAIYAAYKALTLQRARIQAEHAISTDEARDLFERLHETATQSAETHETAKQLVETPETEETQSAKIPGMEAFHGSLKQKAEGWMLSRLGQVEEGLKDRLMVYFDLEDISTLNRWGSEEQLFVGVTAKGSEANSSLRFGLDADIAATVQLPSVTASDLEDSYAYKLLHDLMSQFNVPDGFDDMPDGLDDDFSDGESMPERRLRLERRLSFEQRRLSTVLNEFLWSELLLPSVGLNGEAHYLPAGRSGLLEAWTDVVRLRLEQDRERLALTGREPAALGGIALDFLSRLQGLISGSIGRYRQPMMRRRRRPFTRRNEHAPRLKVQEVALHLEKLIDGDISLAQGREKVPSFAYTQRGQSIPTQRASSMVAELAPLLSWIKNILHPDDLLIIDEPEAHMHPEAVLAVAQTLVALTQSGVKVLCTTHSSEFLHQISNCMLRAARPDECEVRPDEDVSVDVKDESAGMSAGVTGIHVSDIGVYRFERISQSNGGRLKGEQTNDTVIVPVQIDPDWGIPEDEHVAVARHLSDETAELVERIK